MKFIYLNLTEGTFTFNHDVARKWYWLGDSVEGYLIDDLVSFGGV